MGAVISACGKYRYELTREWTFGEGEVCFVMLNPSTADASLDDPTIRRCIGFAQNWGYTRLVVVNLYAYRATNPRELTRVEDPVGPDNWNHIWSAATRSQQVVCAWGKPGHGRGKWMREELARKAAIELHVLGLNKDGSPKHPLYLRGNSKPEVWP